MCSAPLWSPSPAALGGLESGDCGRAPPSSPAPAASAEAGETGAATPRVPAAFWGRRGWEGAARGMEEASSLGGRMAREVPPLLPASISHPHPAAASKLAV